MPAYEQIIDYIISSINLIGLYYSNFRQSYDVLEDVTLFLLFNT